MRRSDNGSTRWVVVAGLAVLAIAAPLAMACDGYATATSATPPARVATQAAVAAATAPIAAHETTLGPAATATPAQVASPAPAATTVPAAPAPSPAASAAATTAPASQAPAVTAAPSPAPTQGVTVAATPAPPSGGGEYSYDTPAATAAASPAPTAAAPPAAGAGTVTISDFAFRPDPVVVAAGGTLTLRNGGRASHTFTILALKIDLTVASGQSATVQIQGAPGTYDLVCRFHEAGGMYAKLEIK